MRAYLLFKSAPQRTSHDFKTEIPNKSKNSVIIFESILLFVPIIGFNVIVISFIFVLCSRFFQVKVRGKIMGNMAMDSTKR